MKLNNEYTKEISVALFCFVNAAIFVIVLFLV